MGEETVDSLELVIQTKAEDAAQKVRDLATSVSDFGKSIQKQLASLNGFAAVLERIQGAISELAKVRNLRDVIRSINQMTGEMKEKAVGKIVPRGSTEVRGGTNLVRFADGSVRRFDESSSAIARGLNKAYGGTNYTTKDLTSRISGIRQRIAEGDEGAMTKLEELAQELSMSAGSKTKTPLIESLEEIAREYGSKRIGVSAKDIAGFGESLKAANDFLANVGSSLRFQKWGNGTGLARRFSSGGKALLSADEFERLGISSPEELYKRVQDDYYRNSGHKQALNEMHAANDNEAFSRVLSDLIERVYKSEVVQQAPKAVSSAAEEVKASVQEAVQEPVKEAITGTVKEAAKVTVAEVKRTSHQYMQQYDPQTGEFNEIPGMRTTQDWMTQYDRDMEAAAQRAERIRRVAADVQTIRESLSFPKDMNYADMINRQMNIDGPVKSAKDSFAAFYPELEGVLNGIKDTGDASEKAEKQIEKLAEATNETKKESVGLRDVLHAVGYVLGNNGIVRVFGQIVRALRMRVFRMISMSLINGVKQGFSNLYQWSKSVEGHFAGAMDTAASKLMLIKNSIATAVSPAIEAMIPLLSTAADWVRNLSNAVAQFFALLNGDNSWTMVMETTEEWAASTKKNTSAAGKSIKDLLADWDELNIIQSQTGGGGSGSTGKKQTDFSKMFQETDVFDKWTENFEQIKGIVTAIGAGIAGWFVMRRVRDFLGQIGIAGANVDSIFSKIKQGIVGAVTLAVGLEISSIAGKGFANEGVTGATVGEMFLGAIASGLGGYLLGSAIGGPMGGVIGAIGGIVLSVGMTIYAYVNEMNTNAREFIEKKLQTEVYGFDVKAEARDVEVLITDAQKARDDVRNQIENVLGVLSVIKLGVNENAYQELYDSVLNENTGLIPKIKKELEADRNIITYYYQFKEKQGEKLNESFTGDVKNSDAFKIQLEANEWLNKEYTRLGEEFAKCFNDGEKKGIKDGKAELMQTILQTITDAEIAAEQARNEAQAEITAVNALKGTNKETVLQNMPSVFAEYEQTLAETNRKTAEANIVAMESEIAQLEKLGAPQKMIDQYKGLLEAAKKEHLETDYLTQAHDKYAGKEAEMALRFIDKYFGGAQGFFGGDIAGNVWASKVNGAGEDELADYMRRQLYMAANEAFGQDRESTLFQGLGIKLEDLLGVDSFVGMRASMAANGFEDDEIRQLFAGAGLSGKFIDSIMNRPFASQQTEANDAVQELTETVAELPEEIADAMDEFADETDGGNEGPSEQNYVVEVGSDTETETDPRVAALENWWDKWRTNLPVGADAALDEAEKVWGDGFWDMFNELSGHIEQSDAPFDLEDIPKDWYENWLNETPTVKVDDQTPLVVDPNASGIVQQSTVDGMANMQERSMNDMNSLLGKACAALANIEESSARTARKSFVVNIGASSGLGQVVNRSVMLHGKVTGEIS